METMLIERLLETLDDLKKTLEAMKEKENEIASNTSRMADSLELWYGKPIKDEPEPELKPCPFCGGEATVIECASYCVRCNTCETESKWFPYGKEAIEAWNRRV